jgi:single-strand DNA-binding protein
MSDGMNKVFLIGNLGSDPEFKKTPTNQALARFTLATNETWKTPEGEKKSKTEWHRIVVWGKQAEVAEKWLKKGKQISIEGKIEYRNFIGSDGIKKTVTEIKCENFIMLGNNDSSDNKKTSSETTEFSKLPDAFDDGDLPF